MVSTLPRRRGIGVFSLCCVLAMVVLPQPAQGSTYEVQGHVGGKRTLVLLDTFTTIETHSLFFSGLAGRGHELTYFLASSPDVLLSKYGEPLYDNLIFFAPGTSEFTSPSLDGAEGIVAFVEGGGNVLMAGEKGMSDLTREIAGEFGVEFEKKRSVVQDHFSYAPGLDVSGRHWAVVSDGLVRNEKVLGRDAGRKGGVSPVVFKGVGVTVESENVLAFPILTGASSTYSAVPNKEIISSTAASSFPMSLANAGKALGLIVAVQARNNARVIVSGSLDFFSDAFFEHQLEGTGGKKVGNELVAQEMSKWGLGERGILRATNVTHHRADGSNPEHLLATIEKPDLPFSLFPDPELNRQSLVYRIKDDIIYSLIIEEYDEEKGGWGPYQADDVQLEFVMLDPHVRTFLECEKGTGRFWKLFKVPDTYGVFKFRILYRRPGLSVLAVNTQVSVRPFNHDEYERFIFSAFPYYASAFSMMAGFLVFGVAFLYSKPKKAGGGKSTKKE
ncbi:dolichyl-diphosphooligosaccharide--protein glycosyltransferase 48 kda subunit [Nannochloropsis oceanica]